MKLKGKINVENEDVQVQLYNYGGLMNLTARKIEGGDNNEIMCTTDNPKVRFNTNISTTCFLANEPNTKLSVAAINESSFVITCQTLNCEPKATCNWTNFEIDFKLS